MCLYIDGDSITETRQIRRLNKNKVVTRYKVLEKIGNRLYSPCIGSVVSTPLISDRIDVGLSCEEIDRREIDHGIHVYTSKEYAESEWDILNNPHNYIVVKVLCGINDLVCIGNHRNPNEEVYMKIRIPGLNKKVKSNKQENCKMIKWNEILGKHGKTPLTHVVERFATENISGDQFLTMMVGTPGIRGLVRDHGVQEARRIARKALKRRGIVV